MRFDPQDGLYVFEVNLGFKVDGETQYSTPYLVQADDPEEAEEKVLELLDELDLDHDFWIEEMTDPYSIEEYEQRAEEQGAKSYPFLVELTEDEFRDLLDY